jgi:hypothetical protein
MRQFHKLQFTRYGENGFDKIGWDDLLAIQDEHWSLWARVEESGSEGIYLEIARWNMTTHQWQRFAFHKWEDPKDNQPHTLAKRINTNGTPLRVIHVMPNYVEETCTSTALP